MHSRQHRLLIAEENTEITRSGRLISPDGSTHDISDKISRSQANSVIYTQAEVRPSNPDMEPVHVSIAKETTLEGVDRLHRLGVRSPCALNFGSGRRPGGGYLSGGNAQEESLCRATTLFPTLEKQEAFYEQHRSMGPPFYADCIMFSPNVVVHRDKYEIIRSDIYELSVITAVAPNRSAFKEGASEREINVKINDALYRRMVGILSLADQKECDGIVLGAWGCGVFANDSEQVARLFSDAIQSIGLLNIRRIHFAIPDQNFDPFQAAFAHLIEGGEAQ